nr:hypothetical protein [Tanacetum cinerariifolium]
MRSDLRALFLEVKAIYRIPSSRLEDPTRWILRGILLALGRSTRGNHDWRRPPHRHKTLNFVIYPPKARSRSVCFLMHIERLIGRKPMSFLEPGLIYKLLEQSVQDSCQTLLLQHLMSYQQRMTRIRYLSQRLMSTLILHHSPVPAVAALKPIDLTGTPSSTSIDQDAPSSSTLKTP